MAKDLFYDQLVFTGPKNQLLIGIPIEKDLPTFSHESWLNSRETSASQQGVHAQFLHK
jgi:hypothetical protein